MTVDPYVDAHGGVLRNRLDIADPWRLREVEAGLTLAALADLGTRILPGGYDPDHLRSFHREIFGDIYSWAGEIRVVGIAKSDPFHQTRQGMRFTISPQAQVDVLDKLLALNHYRYDQEVKQGLHSKKTPRRTTRATTTGSSGPAGVTAPPASSGTLF